MRFGKPTKLPCDHECRVFHRFLWWPITIDGVTRWLETADVEYRYHRCSYDEDFWELVRFVNP